MTLTLAIVTNASAALAVVGGLVFLMSRAADLAPQHAASTRTARARVVTRSGG
jgi:hypothetical protein